MLYLDLFCGSVSKICPAVIASSLFAILAYKRFHRNARLLYSRETCIIADQKGNVINLKSIQL